VIEYHRIDNRHPATATADPRAHRVMRHRLHDLGDKRVADRYLRYSPDEMTKTPETDVKKHRRKRRSTTQVTADNEPIDYKPSGYETYPAPLFKSRSIVL
jgi:hypothetical protein